MRFMFHLHLAPKDYLEQLYLTIKEDGSPLILHTIGEIEAQTPKFTSKTNCLIPILKLPWPD